MKINSENEAKELKTHFVFACRYYWLNNENKLRSFILKSMKQYKIKKLMTTMISMQRRKIKTKEKMEKYCNGQETRKYSVNDDLESLFEDLRLGNEPNEEVETYFLPKLTENELKLVEKELRLVEKEKQKRRFYLRSFYDGGYRTLYVGASRDSVRALYAKC